MSVISSQIIATFVGTILALVSASFVWLFKSLYEKHKKEMQALAKCERAQIENIALLKDNFEFVDSWIDSLKLNRVFDCHFGPFIFTDEETYKISNTRAVTRLLDINYRLRRIYFDLEKIRTSYWEIILKINDIENIMSREESLKKFNEDLLVTLESLKPNYLVTKNALVEAIAIIRVAENIRFHSFFGYVGILFWDLFPRMTQKAIDSNIKLLDLEIKEKDLVL